MCPHSVWQLAFPDPCFHKAEKKGRKPSGRAGAASISAVRAGAEPAAHVPDRDSHQQFSFVPGHADCQKAGDGGNLWHCISIRPDFVCTFLFSGWSGGFKRTAGGKPVEEETEKERPKGQQNLSKKENRK